MKFDKFLPWSFQQAQKGAFKQGIYRNSENIRYQFFDVNCGRENVLRRMQSTHVIAEIQGWQRYNESVFSQAFT